MKKLSIALAVAGAFAATGAGAAIVGDYDQGCLVPSATHGNGADTVVGLTSRTGNTVHWTFFDVNSNHVSDGDINMTPNQLVGFSLASNAGALTTGIQGYLTFSGENAGTKVLASTSESIACNAFYLTTTSAAFIPSPGLTASDYSAAGAANLAGLGPTSIAGLQMGSGFTFTGSPIRYSAQASRGIHMRYWIDGATGGIDTSVVIWTTNPMSAVGPMTVNIYNDQQTPQSITMALPNAELNFYNPETQVGRPSSFLNGFVDWSLPATAASGVLVYSVVSSSAIGGGASQTLMGAAYASATNVGH